MFSLIQYRLFCILLFYLWVCDYVACIYWAFSHVVKYFSATILKGTIVFSCSYTITYYFSLVRNSACFFLSTTINTIGISDFPHRFLCTSGIFWMACPSSFLFLVRGVPCAPPPTTTSPTTLPQALLVPLAWLFFSTDLTTPYILHVFYFGFFPIGLSSPHYNVSSKNQRF